MNLISKGMTRSKTIVWQVVAVAGFISSGVLQAQAQAPAQAEKDWPQDTVVVAQGDVKVTLGDVDAWMQEVTADKRLGFVQSPERIESMLTQLLIMKQLNKEAKASGVDKQPLVSAHARMAAERVIARYQLDAYAATVKTPDLSVLAHERYQADKEKYRAPDIADFTHVLISAEKRGEDQAVALINKLHQRLVKHPADFNKVAKASSDDPSAAGNGGTARDVKLSELVPEFAQALRELKVGEVSSPIKTQYGWHVIRLDKIVRGAMPGYEEVKPAIIAAIEAEFRENTIRAYSDNLRQRELQPNVPVLERLAYRYGYVERPDPATLLKKDAAPAAAEPAVTAPAAAATAEPPAAH